MNRPALLALAVAALLAIGCGDEGSAGDAETQGAPATSTKGGPETAPSTDTVLAAERSGKGITVVDSEFGRVVADAKGEALYLFGKEKGPKSRCYGECARLWPPVITKGAPKATKGADQSLLGTTKRQNGKLQVTYAGHPLYYYVSDSPGTILCHDVVEFGGLWLVVKPNGSAVS